MTWDSFLNKYIISIKIVGFPTFQIIPYHHENLCFKTLGNSETQRILFDHHAECAH